MTPELAQRLRELAAPAHPTEEQITTLVRGWDDLFFRLGLTPAEEVAEFDAIMRMRVRAGMISLVADRFVGNDAYPTRVGRRTTAWDPHRLSSPGVDGGTLGDTREVSEPSKPKDGVKHEHPHG